MTDHNHHGHDHNDEVGVQDWDARYSSEQVWSGKPNHALVDLLEGRLATVSPTTALDVGCGEGADAIWLAQQGWKVTAVDVAKPAIERGEKAAEAAGVDINWVVGDFGHTHLGDEKFGLVSAFYPALLKSEEAVIERLLAGYVRDGGALIFVHHANVDREHALSRGFDPDDYIAPDDVATWLREAGWAVDIVTQDRHIEGGSGADYHEDIVVVAQRPGDVSKDGGAQTA